ncbi:MAG: hypothetical protein ACREV5_01180, partial [Steroidobacter sp.]
MRREESDDSGSGLNKNRSTAGHIGGSMGLMYTARQRPFCALVLLTLVSPPWVIAASEPVDHPGLDLPRATLFLGGDSPAKSGSASEEELLDAAQAAILAHATQLGLDVQEKLVPATIHAGKHGPGVITYRQVLADVEVFGARISAALDGSANVRAVTGGFSPHAKTLNDTAFKLDAPSAVLA